jgi:Domain of unknown function (DUF4440)
MKLKILCLIILLFSKATFAQVGKVKMEITKQMLMLKNALISKDSVALSSVLADDVSYGHTNAMIETKAQLIRSIISREQDYLSIESSEMKIRVYDKTAIVNMKSNVVMKYQNQPLELNMKVIFVWINKNNNWLLVARQSVKMS